MRFDLARQSLRWHRRRLGKPNPRKPAELLPAPGTTLLVDTLRSLAVHCKLTGEADARFRRMLAVYRPKPQREITEDLSKLLDRLADPEVEARLLHLPQLLMHKARRLRDGWTNKAGVDHPPKPMESSWMAALAAAIEIEFHLPLRLHDLARLRLDQELFVTQASGRRPLEVHLRVIANKNGRLVETWLRGEAAGLSPSISGASVPSVLTRRRPGSSPTATGRTARAPRTASRKPSPIPSTSTPACG